MNINKNELKSFIDSIYNADIENIKNLDQKDRKILQSVLPKIAKQGSFVALDNITKNDIDRLTNKISSEPPTKKGSILRSLIKGIANRVFNRVSSINLHQEIIKTKVALLDNEIRPTIHPEFEIYREKLFEIDHSNTMSDFDKIRKLEEEIKNLTKAEEQGTISEKRDATNLRENYQSVLKQIQQVDDIREMVKGEGVSTDIVFVGSNDDIEINYQFNRDLLGANFVLQKGESKAEVKGEDRANAINNFCEELVAEFGTEGTKAISQFFHQGAIAGAEEYRDMVKKSQLTQKPKMPSIFSITVLNDGNVKFLIQAHLEEPSKDNPEKIEKEMVFERTITIPLAEVKNPGSEFPFPSAVSKASFK